MTQETNPEEIKEIPPSNDAGVPLILWITYVVVLVIGIVAFFLFWNGSSGWFDRGYWKELQEAARTTYPFERGK
jgi:hypothetical protein